MLFPREHLDRDAIEVVERLQRSGYTTYLVGGCVRDLLLARTPKDFDIATDASPDELKELFGRRCRIIGRRFRLAHVRSGPKILEVATFRGAPEEQESEGDSGFVVRANTFGTPEEDAHSRDFTINALFYDPMRDEIIDYVAGRADIDRRRIRTIGAADQRFREDPVRILRAIKFAARLGFELDPPVALASRSLVELVHQCPVARVTEEIFRIAESGCARRGFEIMMELGLLETLLPEIQTHLSRAPELVAPWLDGLSDLDRLTAAHGTLPRESVYTLLTWPLVQHAIAQLEHPETGDWADIATELTASLAARMAIPLRQRQRLRGVAGLMRRLLHPPRRFRATRPMLMSPSLPLALALLRQGYVRTGEHRETYERWADAALAHGVWAAPFEPRTEQSVTDDPSPPPPDEGGPDGEDGGGRPRGGRRRRGPRRGRGPRSEAG